MRLVSCSRLARTVDRILRSVLERVMGQRLVIIVVSWSFFGIRIVCVSLQVMGGVCPVDT